MPKKTKIVQGKNETPPATGGSFKVKAGKGNRARRVMTNRKPRETSDKKDATAPQKAKTSMPREATRIAEPSDEAIRLRAYFISERRRRFALPGDAGSDWVEANRQLLSEAGHR